MSGGNPVPLLPIFFCSVFQLPHGVNILAILYFTGGETEAWHDKSLAQSHKDQDDEEDRDSMTHSRQPLAGAWIAGHSPAPGHVC